MHLQFTDGIVQPTTKTIFNFFARPIAKTRDCPWTPLGAPPPTPHHSEEIAATDTNNHNNVASLSKLTASIFYKLIFTEYNAMHLIVCSFAYGWGE